jgi:hypothetical protein
MTIARAPLPTARPARRAALAAAVLALAALIPAVRADTNSARYRFEGNKWLSLDLAIGDVRVEVIKFEWPATLLRIKTGYKATARLVNGSSRQVRAGLAVVLYDAEGKLVGAGTTGTTIGTVDPGDAANFSIDFDHVTERLEQASQFHIALEAK